MCFLSSYDSVHRWEDVKKREKVVLKHSTFKLNSCFVFCIYRCILYPTLYFVFIFVFIHRSGIVHCASVATVVPSIPHYQVIIIIVIIVIVNFLMIFMMVVIAICMMVVIYHHNHHDAGWGMHSMVQPLPPQINWVWKFILYLCV